MFLEAYMSADLSTQREPRPIGHQYPDVKKQVGNTVAIFCFHNDLFSDELFHCRLHRTGRLQAVAMDKIRRGDLGRIFILCDGNQNLFLPFRSGRLATMF